MCDPLEYVAYQSQLRIIVPILKGRGQLLTLHVCGQTSTSLHPHLDSRQTSGQLQTIVRHALPSLLRGQVLANLHQVVP